MLPLAEIERHEVDPFFIGLILKPYEAKDCVYLREATTCGGGSGSSIQASFSIPSSCYIDATGHFNAVELNICYNQMFYLLLADSLRRGAVPTMPAWGIDRFLERQLPGMLITRFQSRFRKPIDATDFQAEGIMHRLDRQPGKPHYLQTSAVFTDRKGGLAESEVEFAILG